MGISYKKLWIRVAENEMRKTDLRDAIGISPNTLSKLSKNEYVSMGVIIKLCEYFDCEIEDVIEIIHKKNCSI